MKPLSRFLEQKEFLTVTAMDLKLFAEDLEVRLAVGVFRGVQD